MSQIPIIPPLTPANQLITAINDRIRRINDALGSSSSGTDTAPGLVSYGTHQQRLGKPVGTFAAGSLWVESDRDLVYQVQHNVWMYASGIMAAAIASRPTDLAATDAGVEFLATDTYQLFRWSGSAWVEATQANLAQIAYTTADTTPLVAAASNLTGATITLTRAGRHLVIGTFDLVTGTTTSQLQGSLVADGTSQAQLATYGPTGLAGARSTITQQWLYTAPATGKVLQLQGAAPVGSGTAKSPGTGVCAIWIGP